MTPINHILYSSDLKTFNQLNWDKTKFKKVVLCQRALIESFNPIIVNGIHNTNTLRLINPAYDRLIKSVYNILLANQDAIIICGCPDCEKTHIEIMVDDITELFTEPHRVTHIALEGK